MKKNKRWIAAFLAGSMILASMTGCVKNTETVTGTTTDTNSVSFVSSTFYGEITAITDNTLTVDVLTSMGMGGMMDMSGFDPTSMGDFDPNSSDGGMVIEGDAQGDAPEAPSGDAQGDAPEAPNGEAQGDVPEAPSGDAQGEAPSGEAQGEAPSGDFTNDQAESVTTDETAAVDADAVDGAAAPEAGGTDDMMMDGNDSTGSMTVNITITDESSVTITGSDESEIALSDLAIGDMISVTVDENGAVTAITVIDVDSMMEQGTMGGDMQMGGSSSGVDSYEAVTTYSEDANVTGDTVSSTGTDENAILVDSGASVTISGSTITRDSDDSTGGDNSSFYGVGAAVLVTDGTVTVSDTEIDTDAAGGAGVFAYGSGVAYVSNCTINTVKNTSGGIHVAGGGTLYAENCVVNTEGESSAAIRSDRGGGTMVVNGGTYTSNGVGSPAVYCTADIEVSNATLTANGSEAVCIEGLNTLVLTDCDLTGNMSDDSQNDCTWTIIVYQSMSGDSEVGNGTFSMTGGSITTSNGGIFYTTNTECTIYLSDVTINYADDNDFFLRVTGNANQRGWGTTGSNGSQCTFTADDQDMEGLVVYDSISTLDFTMQNGSVLAGAFVDDESCAGNGGDGYCNVVIDSTSTWIVTEDSVVTTLSCEGTIVDADGNTVSIVGTDGTVYVEGTSDLTVTVTSYSNTI